MIVLSFIEPSVSYLPACIDFFPRELSFIGFESLHTVWHLGSFFPFYWPLFLILSVVKCFRIIFYLCDHTAYCLIHLLHYTATNWPPSLLPPYTSFKSCCPRNHFCLSVVCVRIWMYDSVFLNIIHELVKKNLDIKVKSEKVSSNLWTLVLYFFKDADTFLKSF